MVEVYPSILEVRKSLVVPYVFRAKNAGADGIHVDIIKNFAPGGTKKLNEKTVKYLRRIDRGLEMDIEAHLMTLDPLRDIDAYENAGVDGITIHAEMSTAGDLHDEKYIRKVIKKIQESGMRVGIAINPSTEVAIAINYLDSIEDIDEILIMSVVPGKGGQKFDESVLYKAEILRELYGHLTIGMDGGINEETGRRAVDAGANKLIAGSYVFNNNIEESIKRLKLL